MNTKFESIIKIIQEAGEILLKSKDINLIKKSGYQNYFTQYDVEVEDFLITNLKKIYPSAGFLAEENSSLIVPSNDEVFIIDPIDGTTNFIHQMNHSAISVALAYKKEVCFSVIYNPFTLELFTAEIGKGAFFNKSRIFVSDREFKDGLIAFGTTPYDPTYRDKTFKAAVTCLSTCREIRRLGTASLDLAYLSVGRYDGFFEYLLQPWDFAAGVLLVKEAGGLISDFTSTSIDVFSPSSVLATNQKINKEIRAILSST